jgi:hypothetical protein
MVLHQLHYYAEKVAQTSTQRREIFDNSKEIFLPKKGM